MAQEPSKQPKPNRKEDWETPQAFFDLVNTHYGPFTLDAAASPHNRKTIDFLSEEENALIARWWGNVWVNPPYNNVARWVEKGFMEAAEYRASVTMLIGARPDTNYWWDYVRLGEVVFIKGRLKFVGAPNHADFPSALVHWSKGLDTKPSTSYWNVPIEQRR